MQSLSGSVVEPFGGELASRNSSVLPFDFEDIAPPTNVVSIPRLLSADSLVQSPEGNALEALRKQNERKYRRLHTPPHTLGSHKRPNDVDLDLELERILLLVVGSLGVILNCVLLLALLTRRALRNLSYAFVVHGVLIDILKATYAILYAIYIHSTTDLLLLPGNGDAALEAPVRGNLLSEELTHGSGLLSAATRWVFGTHLGGSQQGGEHLCSVIGTTYFIVVTVSVVNLIAVLCTETYIFTDDNLYLVHAPSAGIYQDERQSAPHFNPTTNSTQDRPRRNAPTRRVRLREDNRTQKRRKSDDARMHESDDEMQTDTLLQQTHRTYSLNHCCILFAVCIIYVSSLILHLGPTIIASQFDMNNGQDEFYCNLVPGEIRNYISYMMWLFIISLAMFGACYYASVFYRYVVSHSEHRIAGLVRASLSIASGADPTEDGQSARASAALIRLYKNRAHVLMLVLVGYAVCYYPLLLLMISSLRFGQLTILYKVLRIVSLSNPIFTPVVFLTLDRQVRPHRSCLCTLLRCYRRTRSNMRKRKRQRQAQTEAAQGHQSPLINVDAPLREVFVSLNLDTQDDAEAEQDLLKADADLVRLSDNYSCSQQLTPVTSSRSPVRRSTKQRMAMRTVAAERNGSVDVVTEHSYVSADVHYSAETDMHEHARASSTFGAYMSCTTLQPAEMRTPNALTCLDAGLWNDQPLSAPSTARVRRRLFEKHAWHTEDAMSLGKLDSTHHQLSETMLPAENATSSAFVYGNVYESTASINSEVRRAHNAGAETGTVVQFSLNF